MFFREILSDKKFRTLFWLGIFIHLWAAYFSKGYHRPDEHLGMIRYVALKLGMYDYQELLKVNWEFRDQIRSWWQPGIYYLFLAPFKLFGISNPFTLVFLLKMLTGLSYYFATLYLWNQFKHLIQDEKIRLLSFASISLLWFMPFIHVRTTTESFAAIFMAIAVSIISNPRWKKTTLRIFFLGFLLSLIFQVRVPAMSFVVGIFSYLFLINRQTWREFWPLLLGGLATCLVTFLIDSWGYGNWNYSTLTFLVLEFTKDISNGFGISPFYEFFTETLSRVIPPMSIFVIISFLFFWIKNPKHILTWSTLPFFLLHSMIGHKELRFIFPLSIFVPLFLGYLCDQFHSRKFATTTWFNRSLYACLGINFLALAYASSTPALSEIGFYEKMYDSTISPKTIYTYGEIRDQLKFYQNKTFNFSEIKEIDRVTFLEKSAKPIWVMTLTLQDIENFNLEAKCQMQFSSSSSFVYHSSFIRQKLKKIKAWTLFYCP